jgi:hypothetical protein
VVTASAKPAALVVVSTANNTVARRTRDKFIAISQRLYCP